MHAHGRTFEPEVLSRLSAGTEVIVAWHLLDGTTHVAHARDGAVLATFNAWTFEPPEGSDPRRLHQALAAVGFFTDEEEEDEDWVPSEMVLAALEREFGLTLPGDVTARPLPTASLPNEEG
ncbi:DUF6461 domain-containing protein [Streptomyces sp. M19]